MRMDLKYEPARGFYIRISTEEIDSREDGRLPAVFTNIVRKKKHVECQTLVLMKRNHKASNLTFGLEHHLTYAQVLNAYQEVLLCSEFTNLTRLRNYLMNKAMLSFRNLSRESDVICLHCSR